MDVSERIRNTLSVCQYEHIKTVLTATLLL